MGKDSMDSRKIDELMQEYLNEDNMSTKCTDDNGLRVNFDISYSDGKVENHVCGCESDVFCGENNNDNCNSYKKKDYGCNCDEYDYVRKWDNCQEELDRKKYCTGYYKQDNKKEDIKGKIIVYSTLECVEGTRIKGVKINLYKINGISPQLVATCKTDCNGKVEFTNVPEGNYRIIEIIDKRYFNKPSYVSWNEVGVDCNNKDFTIYAVNSVNNRCIKKNR